MTCPHDQQCRVDTHATISSELVSLSNEDISRLLATADSRHANFAEVFKVMMNETPVFVKKIPLTVLKQSNPRSTTNLFHLPTFYQYGVGSAGFGVWRELQAHITTTDWVLTGHCPHFPILYHWRVLQNDSHARDH